jgi:hypothetical protein
MRKEWLAEKFPLILRWKLKHSLGLSEHLVKKITFRLYWFFCIGFFRFRPLKSKGAELEGQGLSIMDGKLSKNEIKSVRKVISDVKGDDRWWKRCSDDGKFVKPSDFDSNQNIDVEKFIGLNHVMDQNLMLSWIEDIFGDALRDYYGCSYKVLCMDNMYITNVSRGAKSRGSFQWHIDDHPPGLIKGFIYLSDVKESDGPFCCLPRSQKQSLKKFELKEEVTDWRFPDDIQDTLKIEPCHVLGESGTAFLANANTIHRATEVIEGSRWMWSFMFLPSFQTTQNSFDRDGVLDSEMSPDRIHVPMWDRA